MRILVLDSDANDQKILSKALKEEGFDVYNTPSAEDAIDLVRRRFDFDLLVMDYQLHDKSGLSTIKTLRSNHFGRPIIVTDINSTPEDRARAMNAGADVLMDWPIDNLELAARARAYIRRYYGHDSSFIQTGNLCVNIDTQAVTVDGEPLRLTQQEYRMMELLALRKGNVLENETFLDHMYHDGEEEPEAKTIDVYISKLRKKLREAGALDDQGKSLVRTVRGHGFTLRDVKSSQLQIAMQTAHDASPDVDAPAMAKAAGTAFQAENAPDYADTDHKLVAVK